MKIHVPEDLGGKLKVLPEYQPTAKIQDIFLGTSKADKPKATVKWVITEECEDKKLMKAVQKYNELDTCVGENVLETFSLQPNAIWNLNDLFVQITGDRIPKDDYDPEQFEQMLKDQLIGGEARLNLEIDDSQGDTRTRVKDRGLV